MCRVWKFPQEAGRDKRPTNRDAFHIDDCFDISVAVGRTNIVTFVCHSPLDFNPFCRGDSSCQSSSRARFTFGRRKYPRILPPLRRGLLKVSCRLFVTLWATCVGTECLLQPQRDYAPSSSERNSRISIFSTEGKTQLQPV